MIWLKIKLQHFCEIILMEEKMTTGKRKQELFTAINNIMYCMFREARKEPYSHLI